MASPTSWLCVTLLTFMWTFTLISSSEETKTVKSGDDVTLQCQSTTDANIRLLEWTKSGLNTHTDGYVFFFRDNLSYEQYQHPSFHGRVQLTDPEMKNGDVSVIVKKVSINDTGTYQCHVKTSNTETTPTKHITHLIVTGSGHTAGNIWIEGHIRGRPGLAAAACVFVVIVVVIFIIYRIYLKNSGVPPPNEPLV